MLDSDLKNQLKDLFLPIEGQIELVFALSKHPDQNDLLDLLNDISQTSPKINLEADESYPFEFSDIPRFKILHNKRETGILFNGIPTGHEFSSLVLAILNSDKKGKFPDEIIINRIKSLKGPIHLKTYISLSCENCPDVVQLLNQMALIHPHFKHEMCDGIYFEPEIQRLGIQGVPSIVANGKLIHSGRIDLLGLITKLENHFGTAENSKNSPEKINLGQFDVAIIGGGPAGASAAIYSVRKGLKTAIIAEKMGGQIQETKGIENMISVIYTEGPHLVSQLREHLNSYPVNILEHRKVHQITSANKNTKFFDLFLDSGEQLLTKNIIVATGAKWRELNVPGEKDYLGRGVAYCPHCDGPFYKDKKIAVVGGGNSGVEAAIDLSGIASEIVLIEFQDQLKADQVLIDKLNSISKISVITSAKITEVIGNKEKVTGLKYQERLTDQFKHIELDGVFVQIGLLPNSQFLKDLVKTNSFGEILVDEKGRTSTPGIYAAGDVTTVPFKQIIISMGEGAKVALAAFEDRMRN